jgi:aldehyde dehydrogenase (NAD+)
VAGEIAAVPRERPVPTVSTEPRSFWLAGRPATGTDSFPVSNPYTGEVLASVSIPTDAQVEEAVAAAYAAVPVTTALPVSARAAALDR